MKTKLLWGLFSLFLFVSCGPNQEVNRQLNDISTAYNQKLPKTIVYGTTLTKTMVLNSNVFVFQINYQNISSTEFASKEDKAIDVMVSKSVLLAYLARNPFSGIQYILSNKIPLFFWRFDKNNKEFDSFQVKASEFKEAFSNIDYK